MILAVGNPNSLSFFVTLGAIAAAVAAGWTHIKGFFNYIKGLVFITVTLPEYNPLQNAVRLYCIKNFKEQALGSRSFTAFFQLVYAIRRAQLIGVETLAPQGCIFWKGWRPIWMKRTFDSQNFERHATLTFIRGTLNVEGLIQNSIQDYNQGVGSNLEGFQRHKIVYVFGANKQKLQMEKDGKQPDSNSYYDNRQDYYLNNKLLKWTVADLVPPRRKTSLDDLALSKEADGMVTFAHKWLHNEKWFYNHRVPWRIGVLLHGDPGTGKTALIRALAQDLDLPVYVFDLASLTNEELFHNWRMMLSNSPCIALLEDMDSVFKERENVTGVAGALTFNSLLNCIDGVERCDGLFLGITTNKVELIDVALSRPGRIDYIIEMRKLTKEGRLNIAKRILCDCPENIKRVVEEGAGDTGAEFQERCSRFAMETFKNGK